MNIIQKSTIAQLSPSASRLLLAFLTALPGENFDDVVLRAGIGSYQTLLKARQQLVNLGYLRIEADGTSFVIPRSEAEKERLEV